MTQNALPNRSPQTRLHEQVEDNDLIDIKMLFGILWRHNILIAAATMITVLFGAYYAYAVATPIYRATSVVLLKSEPSSVVDLDTVTSSLGTTKSAINSELQVLRSRSLMGRVVDEMDLTSDPEFNGSLRAPSTLAAVKQSIKSIFGMGGSDDGIPLDESTRVEKIRQSVISVLLNKVVSQNIPDSFVFQIAAETTSAEKSALLADTVAKKYIENQLAVKFEETELATGWLAERVATLRTDLENAEARVAAFSTGAELINSDTLAALERQLKETRDRVRLADIATQNAVSKLTMLQTAVTPQDKVAAASDNRLSQLLPDIGQPGVQQTFDARFEQVLSRASAETDRTESQAAALASARDTLSSQIDRQSADLIELQQLTRESEASRMLYEYFLTRFKETSAQEGIQQADSRLLSQAVIPSSPSEPKKALIIAMSGFLGAMIGIGASLYREFRHSTYRTPLELERETGYSVMGQIPEIPHRHRLDALTYLVERPNSVHAEAVRNLRTSVLLSGLDKTPQVITLSSALPGEGKTLMSLALGNNFHGMDKKVLIIEGDIRRRTFSEYFDTENKTNLLNVLSKEMSLADAVYHDKLTGVDILFGDKTDVNPVDIFASAAFAALISEARALYDHIIIDTPPVLIVPDARVIAQHSDALLLSVHWDSTLKAQVTNAIQMFESVNLNINGLILNKINIKGMKRYGHGDTYAAYGTYGANYYVS